MKVRVLFTMLLVVVLLSSLLAPFAAAQGPSITAESQQPQEKGQEPRRPPGEYVAPTRAGVLGYEHEYEWVGSQPIPDAECPTMTSITLTVPDSFTINDLRVGFNAFHTWRSDIEIWLVSPAATSVQLLDHEGSLADNFDVLFEDGGGPVDSTNHDPALPYYENSWAPFSLLSAFNGENALGDWELQICDGAGGDTGSVERWALFFNYVPTPDFSQSYKTVDPPKVEAGDLMTYTIVISNTGDLFAGNAVMTDAIPFGTAYVSDTVTCDSGTCWYDEVDNAVYWSGQVGALAAAPIALEAAVPAPTSAGTATNLLQFAESNAGFDSTVPAAPARGPGAILIDQPPNQSNGIFSDANCDFCGGAQVLAESFVLAADASIGQIAFWSGYFPGDVPTEPANLTVIFHADAAGLPGAALYTENNVAYDRAQTGVILFGVHEWINTLTLATPIFLPAGTYWVELYDDTGALTDDMFWETGDVDPVHGILGQAFAFEAPGAIWNYDAITDMAFQLIADIPSSVVVEFAVQATGEVCGEIVNEATIDDPAAEPVVVGVASEAWDHVYLHEEFEGAFPPAGWQVIDNAGSGWAWTDVDLDSRGNRTGGAGKFAIIDDDAAGPGVAVDTELWLPPMDIPPCADTYLVFRTDYVNIGPDFADVDISLDGGGSWINLLHWAASHLGPLTEMVDLSPYAGETGVIIRFHYADGGTWAWWWELDDIQVVSCGREGLFLEPDYRFQVGCPGEVLSYTLSLENCTAETDTFEFSADGNLWPTWLEPAEAHLAWGEKADVTAYVQSTCGADGFDVATIEAVGATYAMSDTAVIETESDPDKVGDWEVMAPLPEGRVFHAAVGTDAYYYVIGGTSDAGGSVPTDTNFRYDVANDLWEAMTPMPATLDSINAGLVGDRIYVPGGDSDDNTYVYDTVGDSWSTIAASDTFTWAIQYSVAVSGTTVYRLGGLVDDGAGWYVSTNRVWALDTVAETWSELPPMQMDRTSFSAASIGGDLYVAGGLHFPGFAPEMSTERFDGAVWSYVAPVPDGGGAYTGWSINADAEAMDKLWLMAGLRDAGWAVLDHTGFYDPATDSWTTTPDLPWLNQGRVYLQGAAAGEYLFATGGRDGAGATIYDVHERLDLHPCVEVEAGITVAPLSLETELCPEGSDSADLQICSVGSCPLDYRVTEQAVMRGVPFTPAGVPSEGPIPEVGVTPSAPAGQTVAMPQAPANPEAVLWDQPLGSNQNAYANQDFVVYDAFDIFIADDFVTGADPWAIDTVFVPGNTWNFGDDVGCAISLTWMIYADAGGVPAGDPWGGGDLPVWTVTLPPTDTAVTLETGTGGFTSNVTLDLNLAGGPAMLQPGTYWLVFYPTMAFDTCGQYGRQTSDTTNGNPAVVIQPGGGFGFPTSWTSVQDPSTWWLAQRDFAFRLEGEAVDLLDWLSWDPYAGLLPSGWCDDVEVTFSAPATPGAYSAELHVESNDPAMPVTTVPVTMTVFEPVAIDTVTRTAATDSCQVGFDATASGGAGDTTFIWDFGDGFGDVGPSVSHMYAAPGGTFTVVLDVTDACGADTWQETIDVTCAPPFTYIYLPIVIRD
jgi:uncharacterized repeat protein (TIGR01451 family)